MTQKIDVFKELLKKIKTKISLNKHEYFGSFDIRIYPKVGISKYSNEN